MNLKYVKDFCLENSWATKQYIYYLSRKHGQEGGFLQPAFHRIGKKILIDTDVFFTLMKENKLNLREKDED